MFDFEKLDVYQKVKALNREVLQYIFGNNLKDKHLADELKRATISIQLNLAEGVGRFSDKEKKHFVTVARGSVFECVAILDVVKDTDQLDPATYDAWYKEYETVSKMLLGLYRNIKTS